jgi:23S rRNA pseudouridine1911/1915/1917 synthase
MTTDSNTKFNTNLNNQSVLVPAALVPVILFEDTHLLVIDKPAGLLSQGEETGEPNLVDWARGHVGRHYVGLVHRLDRNTSGAMVLAKRTKSAQRLTDALQKGTLTRTYLAWLIDERGELGKTQRRWEHFLLKDETTNKTRALSHAAPHAKSAALLVTPQARGVWEGIPLTLAEFQLETGRSHQIRAQSAASGFPILGDAKYGKNPGSFKRPALHSAKIEFEHPMSHERLKWEAPLPEDMRSIQPFR